MKPTPKRKPQQTPEQRAANRQAAIDGAHAIRNFRDITQAELDESVGWDKPEVWNPVATEETEAEKRPIEPAMAWYRGQRSNEDKAAIIRREIRKLVATLPHMSVNAQAKIIQQRLTLPPGVLPADKERLAVSTLRRIITKG